MNEHLLAGLVTMLVAGLGGLLVPVLIRAVPEPDEPAADKEPYAAIAAMPGLAWRSAVASALFGLGIGLTTGLEWSLVWLAPLVPVCVALGLIDWRTRLLPRRIVVPTTLAAIVAVAAVGLLTDRTADPVRALLAMLAVRSFFWLLWAVRSAGMGFGDVRLAAIVGLVLGWVGWGATLIGVWVGFIVFVIPGVTLALVRRDRSLMRKPQPYGPFMLFGAWVGLVWGTDLAAWLWA